MDASPAGDNSLNGDRDDVTALLLEATPGTSRFENLATSRPHGAPAPPPGSRQVLWYGERDERCFLEVRGKGRWTEADAFLETCRSVLEAGRPLSVVLSECVYLDSTFLGTIHQLVSEANAAVSPPIELVGVSPALRHEFTELGMKEVAAAVRPGPANAPDTTPLSVGPAALREHQLRILKAHETLAALSAKNQERFRTVVETLRSELER